MIVVIDYCYWPRLIIVIVLVIGWLIVIIIVDSPVNDPVVIGIVVVGVLFIDCYCYWTDPGPGYC